MNSHLNFNMEIRYKFTQTTKILRRNSPAKIIWKIFYDFTPYRVFFFRETRRHPWRDHQFWHFFCDFDHGQHFRFTPIILLFFYCFHAHFESEIDKCPFFSMFTGKKIVSRPLFEGFSFFHGHFFSRPLLSVFVHGYNFIFTGKKTLRLDDST